MKVKLLLNCGWTSLCTKTRLMKLAEIIFYCLHSILLHNHFRLSMQSFSGTSTYLSEYLAHLLWANCSSCLRFEGCFLQMACFSSFRASIDVRSGLIEGHFIIALCSWHIFSLEYLHSFEISLYPAQIQETETDEAKQTQNIQVRPCQRFTVGTVYFFFLVCYICASVNRVPCQKVLVLSHASTGYSSKSFMTTSSLENSKMTFFDDLFSTVVSSLLVSPWSPPWPQKNE